LQAAACSLNKYFSCIAVPTIGSLPATFHPENRLKGLALVGRFCPGMHQPDLGVLLAARDITFSK
jgi:hypothetical protein